MASKPRSLRCVVCDRDFRRHEHLKRHARIHTHEKPFACACGQAFSRQDLLRRHERKLARDVHHASHSPSQPTDRSNDHSTNGKSSEQISLDTPTSLLLDHVGPGPGPSTATNVDDTAALASDEDLATLSYEPVSTVPPNDVLSNWFPSESEWTLDGSGLFDATSMIPDFDLSSCFLMHDFGIAEDQPPQPAAVNQAGSLGQGPDSSRTEVTALRQSDHHELGEANSISRFGSPLPTLPGRASNESVSTAARTNQSRQGKITETEYRQIVEKLQQVKHILPSSFSLPSRPALSRYLRGYLKGLNEHFPISHTPTLSIARTELVTLLSMATIGAMWCFEARQADTLFFATKSATLHKLDQYSATHHLESTSEGNNVRLHILQALLHLIVAGTWGSSRLLREGLGLQSTAATLARELGFGESRPSEAVDSTISVSERWLSWVQAETRRRTLLMLYSYFNVMSLAYDIPPLILSSELALDMPATVSLWTAETAQEWHSLHEAAKFSPRMTFQNCISSLLTPSSPPLRQESMFTPLDNYITILALLQRIFFLRQAWTARACDGGDVVNGSAAEVPEASNMRAALQRWQARWERSPDSIVDSPTWTGPIPFTSTALLRLAWIRLSTNLGPCRNLASREPSLIADAFFKAPTVHRSSQVTMPILQAVYALAVPVQTGVEFVARAQTVSWSVQHSLCNLECAMFLGKWLEEVAVTAFNDPLAPDELKLVALIRSMMRETSLFYEDDEFARLVSASSVISEKATRMLATAVAKVWAKIFQGTFAFSFANTIGASLRMYADRMEAATANTTREHIVTEASI